MNKETQRNLPLFGSLEEYMNTSMWALLVRPSRMLGLRSKLTTTDVYHLERYARVRGAGYLRQPHRAILLPVR